MKPYRPSNKVPGTGWIWLLALSTLGGAVVGGGIALIARWIYLLLIFPALMGFTSGSATTVAIKKGKVRSPLVGLFFGVLTGLITYGAYHGGEYFLTRQSFAKEIEAELGQDLDSADMNALMDTFFQEETGSSGFVGYLKFSAKQGLSIGRAGSSSDGIPLNETFTWIYWLIELAIIEAISVIMAKSAAKDPFCETCDQWYGQGQRMGTVADEQSEVFLKVLEADQIVQAATHIQPRAATIPYLEVDQRQCPGCHQGEVVLEVQRYSENKKGEGKQSPVLLGMLSHRQTRQLTEAISTSQKSDPTIDTNEPDASQEG
ncbi:hypothetical protein HRE53_17900 [Acaryochloris sp. 'Moss Beach']|uniref:hypothetical protein n=1 Tax=Acaryochloris sp. 'Moss Beach' TaxID=2740837 RepID=UPI001F45CD5B|nr:hypothetical protein [Acaryochloris sp. 'Moss Beach']UJB68404.1 hypothetical protein HRE53_17900 [Acaryochloris sp. 'Moss Beach']